MAKIRITPETREALFDAGLHVLSLYQMPAATRRCAEPSDPWRVALNNHANPLLATRCEYGEGDTATAAILAAIGSGSRRLEREIGSLIDTLVAARSRFAF